MPQQPRLANGILEEIQKVSWPTRKETIKLTIVVIAASLFVGIYVGGLDLLFAQALTIITR